MSRIRTIKPGFFRSKSLAACSPHARLLFAGLWTEADDEGRGVAEPRILAAALFPWDAPSDDTVQGWLDELAPEHITLYEVRDTRYFQVVRWHEHQAAAYRRGTSSLPEPPPNTPPHDSARADVQMSAGQDKTGREGKGTDKTPAHLVDNSGSVVSRCLDLYAEHVTASASNVKNPDTYKAGVVTKAKAEHGQQLRQYLEARPNATAEELACHVLGLPLGIPQSPRSDAWYADPHCMICGGDGHASFEQDERSYFGPCPCRQDTPYLADVIELRRESA